ncbi:Slx4p interacting protein, partial [Massospora cicadina]
FEWAWQKPHSSRHIIRDYPGMYKKKISEQRLPTKLRVLAQLLHSTGFSRWPLHLHFLNSQVQAQFYEKSVPKSLASIPKHISATSGPLELVFPPSVQEDSG